MLSMLDLARETQRLLRRLQSRTRRPAPALASLCPQDKRMNALLKWVQAACLLHGVYVHDETTSFGDGRVLCCLVRVRVCVCVCVYMNICVCTSVC